MFFAFLPYIAQLLLIVHAIKTGQNFNWIWLLVFLPGIGGLIYVFMVLIPDLRDRGSHHVPGVMSKVNPLGEIKKLQAAYELAPTPHNRLQLAREYLRMERWEEASSHISELLNGYYKGDRELSLQLASCRFFLQDHAAAAELYRRFLDAQNPGTTLQSARQAFCAWKLEQSSSAFDDLGRIFRSSGDLECGWLYAQALSDKGDKAAIQDVLDRMKLVVNQHKNFKKTMQTRWVSETAKLI